MNKLILLIILILAGAIAANAQECTGVCLTREQAVQALKDSDMVIAQAAEIVVKDQAIDDLKKEVNIIKIELAKMTGEKTGAEQMNVRLTAIVDILLKNVRPKKIGIINF